MYDEKEQKKKEYFKHMAFDYNFCLDQTLIVNPSLSIIWL